MSQATAAAPTVTRDVYNQIRRLIVRGELAPGQRLQIRELSERFQVSTIPVREALTRLSSELLVQQMDQRGFWVSGISPEELEELVSLRCHIEEIAIRRGLPVADAEWEDRMILAFERLSRAPKFEGGSITSQAWDAAHRQFHAALVSACGWRWVRMYAEQLFDQADRYRLLARASRRMGPPRGDEHKEILDAALARDVEATVALLRSHLTKTAEEVLRRSQHSSQA